MPDPIQGVVADFQRRILAGEAAAAQELTQGYLDIYSRLQGDIQALLRQVTAEGTTPARMYRMAEYKRLMAQIEREIGRYAQDVGRVVEAAQRQLALGAGVQAEGMFVARGGVIGAFRIMPSDAIMALVGALQQESPLRRLTLASMAPDTAAGVRMALLDGLARGRGPREIAEAMRKQFGVPLTRALTISRTEILRAHRMATLANYRANSNVIRGWRWQSALDVNTCMSCIAQHGTLHGLDESLDDHPKGKCVAVPETISMAELGINAPETRQAMESGESWFKGLPAAEQEQRMGKEKYAAWQAGRFNFAQLSQPRIDPDWGRTFGVASLEELLGKAA